MHCEEELRSWECAIGDGRKEEEGRDGKKSFSSSASTKTDVQISDLSRHFDRIINQEEAVTNGSQDRRLQELHEQGDFWIYKNGTV